MSERVTPSAAAAPGPVLHGLLLFPDLHSLSKAEALPPVVLPRALLGLWKWFLKPELFYVSGADVTSVWLPGVPHWRRQH